MLELYAAGGLTQAEREEVELRAATSTEIRAALDEACAAMEAYARLHSVQPAPALKNRILASMQQHDAINANAEEIDSDLVQMYPAEVDEGSPYKWMFAASIALFLLSGLVSFHFYNKWQQAEERLAVAMASEQRFAQNLEVVSLKAQQQEQALAVLRDPAFKTVKLVGVEGHPDANMRVYWNPQRQQVYVDLVNLPQPPAGKQYQLWALDNGKPVDAGMIAYRGTNLSMQQMKAIGSAQAFAVTLEPAGGSKNPTLEQLMVMGKVES